MTQTHTHSHRNEKSHLLHWNMRNELKRKSDVLCSELNDQMNQPKVVTQKRKYKYKAIVFLFIRTHVHSISVFFTVAPSISLSHSVCASGHYISISKRTSEKSFLEFFRCTRSHTHTRSPRENRNENLRLSTTNQLTVYSSSCHVFTSSTEVRKIKLKTP